MTAMRRFRVAEESMTPTLTPGEEFVATSARPARVGEVVALPHPERADFWLVKRLSAGPGDMVPGRGRLSSGEGWVVSDNHAPDAQDSRSFGPVPIDALLPRVDRLDRATFQQAVELLAVEEPAFARVVDRFGRPDFWERPPGFPTLVWLILEQQVSLESGAAMFRRLAALLGEVSPEAVLVIGEQAIRGIGVTRQKTGYLIGLADSVATGAIDLDLLGEADPGTARATLLDIHGIGPWTADAYLLSALGLPDVFPIGDRALQVGTAEVLGLDAVPRPDELELLSTTWAPIRAAAARLIWHSYLARRGRLEPQAPDT